MRGRAMFPEMQEVTANKVNQLNICIHDLR